MASTSLPTIASRSHSGLNKKLSYCKKLKKIENGSDERNFHFNKNKKKFTLVVVVELLVACAFFPPSFCSAFIKWLLKQTKGKTNKEMGNGDTQNRLRIATLIKKKTL